MQNEGTRILSAFILKLSCSGDDLAWLTPFVLQKKWFAFIYIFAMEIVVRM